MKHAKRVEIIAGKKNSRLQPFSQTRRDAVRSPPTNQSSPAAGRRKAMARTALTIAAGSQSSWNIVSSLLNPLADTKGARRRFSGGDYRRVSEPVKFDVRKSNVNEPSALTLVRLQDQAPYTNKQTRITQAKSPRPGAGRARFSGNADVLVGIYIRADEDVGVPGKTRTPSVGKSIKFS